MPGFVTRFRTVLLYLSLKPMGFAIFLIILLVIWLCWPAISRWLQRMMLRRTEDIIRRMTGMPPRKEEERSRRNRQKESGPDARARRGRGDSRQSGHMDESAHQAMRSYAEDVEFTEVREFSQTTISENETSGEGYRYESQVSDAEFTEIKTGGKR